MRNHFAAELLRMAQEDPSIYVMTGDLGYGVWDKFAETYPDRFINAGISEEHMTAAAAGLALEGNTVYTYSIGNFPGMRCLEWIRNDICYHHANVKILAVGGGFCLWAAWHEPPCDGGYCHYARIAGDEGICAGRRKGCGSHGKAGQCVEGAMLYSAGKGKRARPFPGACPAAVLKK